MVADEWSEMFASDVDERAALVVRMPHQLQRADWKVYVRELQKVAESSYRSSQPGLPVATPYQIGPTAEWRPTFLLTFEMLGSDVLQAGASLVQIAQGVLAAARKIRQWNEEKSNESDTLEVSNAFAPVFSLPVIIGMCLDHYQDHHAPLQGLAIDSHARVSNMYGGVGHPAGVETYTISIKSSVRTLVYVVDAYGDSNDHYEIRNGQVLPLPLPNWLDRQHFPQYEANRSSEICLE